MSLSSDIAAMQDRLRELAALGAGWLVPESVPVDPRVVAEVSAVLPRLNRRIQFSPDGEAGISFDWTDHPQAFSAEVVSGHGGALLMFLMRWDTTRSPRRPPAELHEDVPYDRETFVRFLLTGTAHQ